MKKTLLFALLLSSVSAFAQVPAVTATTKWQVVDGNSTWFPSLLDIKTYVLNGLAGLAPTGGTTGQVLTKINGTDYNYNWQTPSGGGGGSSDYLGTGFTSGGGSGSIPAGTSADFGTGFSEFINGISGQRSGIFMNQVKFSSDATTDYGNSSMYIGALNSGVGLNFIPDEGRITLVAQPLGDPALIEIFSAAQGGTSFKAFSGEDPLFEFTMDENDGAVFTDYRGTGSSYGMQYSNTYDYISDLQPSSLVPKAYVDARGYSGTVSTTGTATTTFTVTIGATLPSASYQVSTEALNALSSAVHYVTNKTTTTFDVVYLAGLTGAVSFDWIIKQ